MVQRKGNHVICDSMNKPREHYYVKRNKPVTDKYHMISLMCNLKYLFINADGGDREMEKGEILVERKFFYFLALGIELWSLHLQGRQQNH